MSCVSCDMLVAFCGGLKQENVVTVMHASIITTPHFIPFCNTCDVPVFCD